MVWFFRQVVLTPAVVTAHVVFLGFGLVLPALLLSRTLLDDDGLTLRWWLEALRDPGRWMDLLGNTLVVGGLGSAGAAVGGLLLAIPAFKLNWAGRSAVLFACILLAGLPPFITGSTLLGLIDRSSLSAPAVVAGGIHALVYLPLAAVLIGLGLIHVEPQLEEAGLLDQPPLQVLLRISIPRAAWSIAAVLLIVFWLISTDYFVTDVLGVETFAREIYNQYQLNPRHTTPFLLAVPLMLVLATGFVLLSRRARGAAAPLLQSPDLRHGSLTLSRGQQFVVALPAMLPVLLAGTIVWVLGGRIGSAEQGLTILKAIAPEWRNTLVIAGGGGALLAGLSISTAWLLCRGGWWRWPVSIALLSLLCTPAPALAITLSQLLNRSEPRWLMEPLLLPLYDSVWIDVIVLTLRFLPVAALIALPAVYRVPPSVHDLARLDGLSWLQQLRGIYWPAGWTSAMLAGVVGAILCLGELDCVHLISPPGIETLSKRLFSFIHSGVDAQVAVVCLASALSVLPAAVLLWAVLRRVIDGGSRGYS